MLACLHSLLTCCMLRLMLLQLSLEEYQKLPVGHYVLLTLASEPDGVYVTGVTERLGGDIRIRRTVTGVLVPEADIVSLSAGIPCYIDSKGSWWTMRAALVQVGCRRCQQLPMLLPSTTLEQPSTNLLVCSAAVQHLP